MKKFSKIVLASGIVLGFSVTPELFNATLANLFIIIMMVILRIKVIYIRQKFQRVIEIR